MLKRLDSVPLHMKLLLGFALVLAISAAQSGFAYWTTLENHAADAWVDHTEQVLSVAGAAQMTLFEMTAAYRGFMLSGDEALLDPYTAGVQTYTVDLARLEQLTADNPLQVERWRDLEQRLTAWQREVVEPDLALRRTTEAGISVSSRDVLVVAQRSFDTEAVSEMQRILGDAMAVEQELLSKRSQITDALDQRLMQALVGGTLVVLGIGTLVAILFARSLAHGVRQVAAAADEVRASERKYRQMFENNEAIKLLIDPEAGIVVEANAAACQFYGYSLAELLGRPMSDIITLPADEFTIMLDRLVRHESSHFETRHRLASGEIRDVEIYSSPLSDPNDAHRRGLLYSIIHDITDRTRATEALRHQALHDSLTGLPNRILLREILQREILLAQHEGTSLALLLLDLDRFKEINDTFGHQYGDRLLQQIGPRLRGVLRVSDAVARLGGDEFAVLLPGAQTDAAAAIAQLLLQALNEPFMLEEHQVEVGASVGIVASPVHGNDAESLLRRADVAMYVAKSSHSGLAIYTVDQDHHSSDQLALVGELRQAIDEDQLVLHSSQRWTSPVGWRASRRSCAGSTPVEAWSSPTCLSGWLSTRASSSR
ncbi:MAG: diguanylate cyclase [Chloroflexota bacterium]|nr:diguanylate cyclase [Chloroflexota bacterium]